jgi:hypothetical protein
MQNYDGREVRLSPGQQRFAEEHDARLGMGTPHSLKEVFLYHDDSWATYRWLVDDSGRAIDSMTFRKSPPGCSRRGSQPVRKRTPR